MTSPVGDLIMANWREDDEQFVYFVQNPANSHVKIGRTRNLSARLATLRTAIPDLLFIAAIHGGKRAEAELHETFASRRRGGEWFEPDLQMAHTIAALVRAAREATS